MKKLLVLLLMLSLFLGLTACAQTPIDEPQKVCGVDMEHSWSDWSVVVASTDLAPGQQERSCTNCGQTQTQPDYEQMFTHYAHIRQWCGPFETEEETRNPNKLGAVITAAWFNNIENETTQNYDYSYKIVIKVEDMHAFTQRYYGVTCDYTDVWNVSVGFEAKCNYRIDMDALVIKSYPTGYETGTITNVEYTTQDDVHFDITIHMTDPDGVAYTDTMAITKIDDKYIITG